jgi:hypothetical protein
MISPPTEEPAAGTLSADNRDPPAESSSLWDLPPELIPNIDDLVIEDGKPVDGIFSEKQMRLLTEPLHSGWSGPPDGQSFVVMANVGLFHALGKPPLVPEVLLARDVEQGPLTMRANRTYVVWLRGKTPDVVVEIVSRRDGGEDTTKLQSYAQLSIPYYVILDPDDQLGGGVLRAYQLRGRTYQLLSSPFFFPEVGLGACLWQGPYEDREETWLRWCDRDGTLIPTGTEQAEIERQRAENESQRAENERRQAEKERERAEGEWQRAENERHQAENERQRADNECQRAENERRQAEKERERAEGEWQRAENERHQAENERQRADNENLRAESERRRAEQAEAVAAETRLELEQAKERLRVMGLEPSW